MKDENLIQLEEAYNTSIVIRSHEIKIQETENTEQVVLVIQKCFELIDIHHKLSFQDVHYLIQLAKEHRLKSFKGDQLSPVVKTRSGKLIYPKTLGQAVLCDAFRHNDIVFATGVAGTGKTYLAVAYAVNELKNERIEKIILTRPAVEAGESLGFLPGDMKEKVDPYLRPLYDALFEMLGQDSVEKMLEKQIIEIAPLAFMRGRTLNNAIVILDEAQNTTRSQMKMFLTRMGQKTKMIINGDASQIDLIKKNDSGLVQATQILKNIRGIGMIHLDASDVVRHPLVQKIIECYAKIEN
ncbi:MAG: PhoH family protein [Bacillota bacterium]|nr:PhoH family protein [Bacillota bacterium]